MYVALYHKHYDQDHLEEVKEIMTKRGAPVVRAIWSEVYGMWMAIEACHRLRGAHDLGIKPIIKDISGQKSVRTQMDGGNVRISVKKLGTMMEESLNLTDYLTFEEM